MPDLYDFTLKTIDGNQFGGQEPGSDADVKAFCTSGYGVRTGWRISAPVPTARWRDRTGRPPRWDNEV